MDMETILMKKRIKNSCVCSKQGRYQTFMHRIHDSNMMEVNENIHIFKHASYTEPDQDHSQFLQMKQFCKERSKGKRSSV
jgi:hypothetical protein